MVRAPYASSVWQVGDRQAGQRMTRSEQFWANYKRQAEKLLSDEYEAVLRKVLQ